MTQAVVWPQNWGQGGDSKELRDLDGLPVQKNVVKIGFGYLASVYQFEISFCS